MKNNARSDTSSKPKAKQRSERYLKYQKYIRSKQFKNVRKLVFERDGYACVCCNRKRTDGAILSCHHKTYEHLFEGGQTEANDCITVCQYCHKGIHSIRSNYKWFAMDNNRNKTDDDDDEET